jgi:nucleoside-diphosphate-sugar epimerase
MSEQAGSCYQRGMRALVIGSTGFVGAALCARLAELGHVVVAGSRGAELVAGATRAERVELGDPTSIASAAHGVDVIFQCAGDHDARSARAALEWLHVAGTENTVRAARHAGVPRVVLLSCADATLSLRNRVHWREDAVLGGQPLGAVARSKLLGEEVALQLSDAQCSVTALRPAFLWGAGERHNLPALCAEGLSGGIRLYGSGDNLFSTAHIDLVVDGLIAAASAPDAGGFAIHVADPDTLTAHEHMSRMSQALSLPPPSRGVFALELLKAYARQRFGGGGPTPTDVVRRARHSLLDCLRATTLLQLEPRTSFEEGMQALSAWTAQNGGAASIAQRTRAPATATDAERYARLADDLS